jgi:hypothetical protein
LPGRSGKRAQRLELAGIVLSELSYDDVLDRAVHIVKRTVPAAAEVSGHNGERAPVTVVFTGRLAADADESQYQVGYGPCLDAIRLTRTVVVKSLDPEVRWPTYTPRALDAGVRSSVSVPLPVEAGTSAGSTCTG